MLIHMCTTSSRRAAYLVVFWRVHIHILIYNRQIGIKPVRGMRGPLESDPGKRDFMYYFRYEFDAELKSRNYRRYTSMYVCTHVDWYIWIDRRWMLRVHAHPHTFNLSRNSHTHLHAHSYCSLLFLILVLLLCRLQAGYMSKAHAKQPAQGPKSWAATSEILPAVSLRLSPSEEKLSDEPFWSCVIQWRFMLDYRALLMHLTASVIAQMGE